MANIFEIFMDAIHSHQKILTNDKAVLAVDLFGGAITDFRLKGAVVNPLCFKYSAEEMPLNNKNGAPYQGHFLCLGRWGEPSGGEIKAGLPNHGQLANILWDTEGSGDDLTLSMKATSALEGLAVTRRIQMDQQNAVVFVEETVNNINPLGRLFNMVQHPTLSAPFLNSTTVVDCNASLGFNQAFNSKPDQYAMLWPLGHCPNSAAINLRSPSVKYNSLFSFLVDRNCTYGWITAYSPKHRMILGYLWKRSDYPWIHHWQHWDDTTIQYRGLEFGTAGYHMPFKEMISHPLEIFNESACAYIDAGETIKKRFIAFVATVPEGYEGVKQITVEKGKVILEGKNTGRKETLDTAFINFLDAF